MTQPCPKCGTDVKHYYIFRKLVVGLNCLRFSFKCRCGCHFEYKQPNGCPCGAVEGIVETDDDLSHLVNAVAMEDRPTAPSAAGPEQAG